VATSLDAYTNGFNVPEEKLRKNTYANSESKSPDDDVDAATEYLTFRNLLKDTINKLGEVAKALA